MTSTKYYLYSLLLCCCLVLPRIVLACPLVGDLLDYTCDGQLKFVITGDSVVAGVGDTENDNRGGYVTDLETLFPQANFVNLGVSGITSGELLRRFLAGTYRKQIRKTDVLIIDVARNDCSRITSPLGIFRNVKRLRRYLLENVGRPESRPFVVVATQIPVRGGRRPCVEAFNSIMIRRQQNHTFPAYPRFDTLPDSVLSYDGLHPDTAGYERIAKFTGKFIRNKLQELLLASKPEIAPEPELSEE